MAEVSSCSAETLHSIAMTIGRGYSFGIGDRAMAVEVLMGRYIEPMTDFGFKKLFVEAENKEILIDMLNAFLGYSGDDCIESVEVLTSEALGKSMRDRRAIFDLYCRSLRGEYFVVEMQRCFQYHYVERAFFYSARAFDQQSKQGDWDYKLDSVCSINLLGFHLSRTPGKRPLKEGKYFYSYRFVEDDDPTDILPFHRLIFVELGGLQKQLSRDSSRLEKWVYMLKHISTWDEPPPYYRQDRVFDRFFEHAEVAQYNTAERLVYERSLRELRDEYAISETHYKEGVKKGFNQGIEQGIERGQKRQMQKILTNLRAMGRDDAEICQILGIESIEALDES